MKFALKDFLKRELLPEEELPFYYVLEILNLKNWPHEDQTEIIQLIKKHFPENLEKKVICKYCLEHETHYSCPYDRKKWGHCFGDLEECCCLCAVSRREVELVDKLFNKKSSDVE